MDGPTDGLSTETIQNDNIKIADDASDQSQPTNTKDDELQKRTMVTLMRSEMISNFLKARMEESRKHFEASRKENEGPNIQAGTKRKLEDSNSKSAPNKKAKSAKGAAVSSSPHIVANTTRQPKLLEGAVLRDYQLDGLDWLVSLDMNGASGILADEMGLGKTIQVIALITFLIEVRSADGPFLILGPLSTVPNWANEFAKFAPKIPVVVYHGSKACRASLRRELRREHIVDGMRTFPVVITSYGMPLQERALRSVSWRYLVVDEGHRLKNHKSALSKELRLFKCVNRLLLTGTPLQNNLTELWALLNFCLPDVIDDQYVFESWFSECEIDSEDGTKILEAEQQKQVLTTLHKVLKPFVLRRKKADVGLNLPPKRELIVYAPLTPMQLALYNYVVQSTVKQGTEKKEKQLGKRRRAKTVTYGTDEDIPVLGDVDESNDFGIDDPGLSKLLREFFEEDEELVSLFKFNNPLMILRKICQHPYLNAFPVIPGTRTMQIDERLVTRSGKMRVLDALLKRLHAGGHKVLLFSNFTMVLDLLEDYLSLRNYKYCRLDGSRSLDDRQENIDKFSDDAENFLFLISTRAGGLGINLVAADTVIIFDSDWNPQADLQAQDRCHRIGQTKPVVVYRLVVGGSVDEKLVERAESKLRLDRLVINHGKFKCIGKEESLSAEELQNLLKIDDRQKINRPNEEVLSNDELDTICSRKALFASGSKTSQDGVFKVIKD